MLFSTPVQYKGVREEERAEFPWDFCFCLIQCDECVWPRVPHRDLGEEVIKFYCENRDTCKRPQRSWFLRSNFILLVNFMFWCYIPKLMVLYPGVVFDYWRLDGWQWWRQGERPEEKADWSTRGWSSYDWMEMRSYGSQVIFSFEWAWLILNAWEFG